MYPQDDGHFYLIYRDSNCKGITQVTIDKEKKLLSPVYTYKNGKRFWPFKKQRDNIFVHYHNTISKLNLDLSVAKTVDANYSTPFLSANGDHVYAYSYKDNQLCIFNKDLELLKQVGQLNNPADPFYFSKKMKHFVPYQFECHKGKY